MSSTVRSSWLPGAERVRALARLDRPRDLRLLVRIFFYAALLPLRTRARPSAWARFAEPHSPSPAQTSERAIRRAANHVDAALVMFRPVLRSGCLVRGLTLYHFLREAGADVSLSFGLEAASGDFMGHCWLVRDGVAFLEEGQPDLVYTETFRLPREAEPAGA